MSEPRQTGKPLAAPAIDGLLETSLYVDDLGRAARFYEATLGLERLFGDERLIALAVPGRSVLLLFRRGTTLETVHLPGGTIPPHDGDGSVHLAFAVSQSALPDWEERLGRESVPIEGRTRWPRGGESIYFRDPDLHLVELATPGLWTTY